MRCSESHQTVYADSPLQGVGRTVQRPGILVEIGECPAGHIIESSGGLVANDIRVQNAAYGRRCGNVREDDVR
ncbi:MAG TPA: hypothetical protein VLL56_00445 [Terriglobia bacterium]|nr:hypothetical protein [Terriglobia bacterium]